MRRLILVCRPPPVEVAMPARPALAPLALVVVAAAGSLVAWDWVTNPARARPHDFLQVWAAGRLTLDGHSPYDGRRMRDLQCDNRSPVPYASMMWVPPWGHVVALPVGALPVDMAQAVWTFGQGVLIVATALAVWRAYGGAAERWWVPTLLAVASGPVWWQLSIGQYAGLLLAGLGGYLIAHRSGRPVLAGACLFLIALKPHLFALFAVGLLVDAARTAHGRRVVLGGAVVLAAAAALVTAANPEVWAQYRAATGGGYTDYYPGFYAWFPPTPAALVRYYLPERPMWVQFVPLAVVAPLFAAYWWRHGGPDRWPDVLVWLVPVQLVITPYSGWPSDLVLLLVPAVLLAVKLDAAGWPVPRPRLLAATYLLANAAVPVLRCFEAATLAYVWAAPALAGCLYWAGRGLRAAPADEPADAEAEAEVAEARPVPVAV